MAGPVVSELTALTCATFFDGVNQLSSDVAKLPLPLKRRNHRGGADDATDLPVFHVVKSRPNPECGSLVLRQTMTAHALIYGDGYAEIGRDSRGRPSALWVMHPRSVQPFYDDQAVIDGRRRPLRYRIDGNKILESRDVLHIHGLGDDGVTGYGLVKVAREAIGLALASQQFASAFFGNGTRFGGILSSETQDIDAEQEQEIRERIEALHARSDKAFRLLVLGMGFKFQESGTTPTDAQMKEIRDQQVMEVARFLNMPLHKLKLSVAGAVSYASVEQSGLEYLTGCLQTWITLWEEELNAKLIEPRDRGQLFFKHNVRALLRSDFKSQNDALGAARDRGVINADEWREWLDMNPQPGDQGKLYLVNAASVPQNTLEASGAAARGTRTAPPPEVLTAHRQLIADVARRLIGREVDRARGRTQSFEKLRAWMATFYVTFTDAFAEALVPALRVQLAWRQSSDDPRAVAQAIAARHVEESTRQLNTLAGADPADLTAALGHVLRRWETDRPEQLADAILQDEIRRQA